MTPIPVAQRYLNAKTRLEPLMQGKSDQELWQLAELCFGFSNLLEDYPRLATAFATGERSLHDKLLLLERVYPQGRANEAFVSYFEDIIAGVHPLMAYWIRQAAQDGGVAVLFHIVSLQPRGLVSLADELFEIQEFLLAHRDVRNALGDTKGYSKTQRVALAQNIFADQVSSTALRLLERAVERLATSRKHALVARSLDSALEHYVQGIMALSNCQSARIYAARPLSQTQRERVQQVLERKLGHAVHLQVAVDPHVLGGLKIQIGSRVFDGTLASMFNQTKAIFAP